HEALYGPQLDQDIVIHVDAKELIDRLSHEIHAAEAIRIVDLTEAPPRDLDAQVPGNREDPRPLRSQVQADHHHRVGTSPLRIGEILVGPVAVEAHAED